MKDEPEQAFGILCIAVAESHGIPAARLLQQQATRLLSFSNERDPLRALTCVMESIQASRRGEITAVRALATISVQVAHALHSLLCCKDTSYPGGCCRRDVKAASDYAYVLANTFLHMTFRVPLSTLADDALMASTLSDADAVDATEVAISRHLHPRWLSRQLLPLERQAPIIQVHSAISQIPEREFEAIRDTATRFSAWANSIGYQCEVTSDYAVPTGGSDTNFPDESLTRAGIYRASAEISFADWGHFGTAHTWAIAEMLGIPLVILFDARRPMKIDRYTNALGLHQRAAYHSLEEALQLAQRFVEKNADAIHSRNETLVDMDELGTGRVSEAMKRIDVSHFEEGALSFAAASFITQNGPQWWQTPLHVRNRLLRTLNLDAMQGRPDTGERRQGLVASRDALGRTGLFNLFSAAELGAWSWEQISAVAEDYLDEMLSSRVSASTKQPDERDWNQRARRLGWDG